MGSTKKNTQTVEEETVEVFQLPYGAIPFTLSEKGMCIESEINGVPAAMLLLSRFNNFTLDSTFVFSNLDSLKMKIETKSRKVCRDGVCRVKMASAVVSPVTLSLGNDIQQINKNIDIFNLKNLPGATFDMEVPIVKILKDKILLLDVSHNYLKTDITQDSLKYFIEDFEVIDIDIIENCCYLADSLSIYTQEETLSKKGVLWFDFNLPYSIIYKMNFTEEPQQCKGVCATHIDYAYNTAEKETMHTDSIVFTKLKTIFFDTDIAVRHIDKVNLLLAILGLDFFQHYCAVFDFNEKKMYLKEHQK